MTQPRPNLGRAWRRTFWQVYDNLGLFLLVNTLWFLLSITIIGLPTATSALFHVAYLVSLDRPLKLKDFFIFLRKKIFISTFITILLCVTYLFLLFNIRFYLRHFGIIGVTLSGISFWLLIILLMTSTYVFPLQCRYSNYRKILKYSFILTLDNLKTTFILFITTGIFLCLEIVLPIISIAILAVFTQNAFLEIESMYNSNLTIIEPRRNFRELWKIWNFS